MYRKQLKKLEKWVAGTNRKSLVLRGARQVGKSTLVRLFAEQEQQALVEVNLERYPQLAATFEQKDTTKIIDLLEALPNTGAITQDSLLFLDEIQAVPAAIPALRYFYEDKAELALVAAGSLLEFTLSDHQFSMPVGRIEYLHMGPMTFIEFLLALNEQKLAGLLQTFAPGDEINPILHNRLMALMRSYFFVGGMPEAVKAYSDRRQLSDVSRVHNSIIDTYRDDFPKYIGSRNLSRIQNVFNFAARNVGCKVKYSQFSNQDKAATIKKDIELLCMAKVLSKVIHSHSNGLPLQADIEEKIYKLIFLDVGLMNVICGLTWNNLEAINDAQLVNEGSIAEQFIGQHLQDILSESPNRELNYWLREGRANNAEIDYVVALNGKVVPIEIKSGAAGSLKSLHQFCAEKNTDLAIRFDANLPSLQTINTTVKQQGESLNSHYQLRSLPLYLVERLADFI